MLAIGAEFNGFHGDFSLCDSFLNPDPLLCTTPEDLRYQSEVVLPTPPFEDEFEFYQPPKRQKINCSDGLHYSNSSSDITFSYQFTAPELSYPNVHVQKQKQGLQYSNSSSDITFDYQYSIPASNQLVFPRTENVHVEKEKKNVSPQSVSARQRRRKISQKTQKLGKLIPGGNRMNTAEMFHAAFKYIKFLQAQVGMLQLMQQQEKKENEEEDEGLELLLASSSVHEKLYSEEKCLVPKKFVADHLAKDDGVKSIPFVSKQIELIVKKD